MNANIRTSHPELTALVLSKYLIRRSITPNPVTLEDGTIRYFIVSPNQATVQGIMQNALVKRGLPYTLTQAGFTVTDGAYLEFKGTGV